MKPCKLYSTLAVKYPDELHRIEKDDRGCNFDISFLGFTDIYEHLSKIIPKHWTIIDLGCCAAFQSYYFRNHRRYVGVDLGDVFFQPKEITNAEFYGKTDIMDFIGWWQDDNPQFAIMSYVTCWQPEIRVKFKNLFVFYPETK